jgi:hypothetical protein
MRQADEKALLGDGTYFSSGVFAVVRLTSTSVVFALCSADDSDDSEFEGEGDVDYGMAEGEDAEVEGQEGEGQDQEGDPESPEQLQGQDAESAAEQREEGQEGEWWDSDEEDEEEQGQQPVADSSDESSDSDLDSERRKRGSDSDSENEEIQKFKDLEGNVLNLRDHPEGNFIDHMGNRWSMLIINDDTTQKTTAGGRTLSYRALVVLGNLQGCAGFGKGKGESPEQALNAACR